MWHTRRWNLPAYHDGVVWSHKPSWPVCAVLICNAKATVSFQNRMFFLAKSGGWGTGSIFIPFAKNKYILPFYAKSTVLNKTRICVCAVAQNSTNQHFTAGKIVQRYRNRNRPLQFAIIAPRKIALGSDFSAVLMMQVTWKTPEYRQKPKERGKTLSCSSKILSANVLRHTWQGLLI